eukprot:1183692-Prorocentrum_minimum.AAC.1
MTEDQQREHAEKRKKHMAMLPAIELAVRSGFEAEEHALDVLKGPRGAQWKEVGNWTQGEKRGRVSGVLSAPLPLLAQEDP